MGKRILRRKKKKDKIKSKIRIAILGILFCITFYVGIGIYKENKIKLVEENNLLVQKVVEEIPIVPVAPIEIPNLETYVLKDYTIEGMKVCSSKFFGPEPNEVGNFCIAGHNYEQENMFNHLINLEKGDELYLSDNKNGKVTYTIYDIYRVKPQNTAPIGQETNGNKIVTLITCVNYSRSRLIVQAVEKM